MLWHVQQYRKDGTTVFWYSIELLFVEEQETLFNNYELNAYAVSLRNSSLEVFNRYEGCSKSNEKNDVLVENFI